MIENDNKIIINININWLEMIFGIGLTFAMFSINN